MLKKIKMGKRDEQPIPRYKLAMSFFAIPNTGIAFWNLFLKWYNHRILAPTNI